MARDMEAERLERLSRHMQQHQPLLILSLLRDLQAEKKLPAGVEVPLPDGNLVTLDQYEPEPQR